MLKNKRKLVIIIAAVVLVIGIAAGTTLILVNNSKKDSTPTIATANFIKAQAIEALKNNDTAKAKTLFEEAQKEYKSLGDTTNAIDTDAQLYMINHPSTSSSSATD